MSMLMSAIQIGTEVLLAYGVSAGVMPVEHDAGSLLAGVVTLTPFAWSIADWLGPEQQNR
jgi:hypothetical protein